jgi:tetratricopeptide (TPR) repeat protein
MSDGQDPTANLKTAVRHAMALFGRGEHVHAHNQAQEILRLFPAEPNSAFIIAAINRVRGDPVGAAQALEQLLVRVPDFGLAWQEFGFAHVDLGALAAGKDALQRAVGLGKPLPDSWKMLAELASAAGDEAAAAEAADQYALARATDPRLVEAVRAARAGALPQAERACRGYVHDHPDDVTGIRLLADIGVRVGALDDAEHLFRRCLELAPDFTLARLNYAQLLSKRERLDEALTQVDNLLQSAPKQYAFLTLKASIHVKRGDFDSGITLYEQLLSQFEPRPMTTLVYGHALKTVGRQAKAIEAYRQTIALQPSFGDAYWSLANLKTFRFDDADILSMRSLILAGTGTLEDHFHLRFALGKALEDRGEYAESFEHYQRGNAIKVDIERYSATQMTQQIEATIQTCTAEFFTKRHDGGCASPDPIFIVGLPRSGSTLLEQILSSHSQVDGTKELLDIPAIVRRLTGRQRAGQEARYPQLLMELDVHQRLELGEEYLRRTRVQRGNASFFIDKMPNNFRHIGLIQLILPNARIIDARRHPMAACFSAYTQLFAQGQSFTYGLENIGAYYRDYLRLMDHWDLVLPNKVLRVEYEDVTTQTEREVRRLLAYCGLPFESACLEFYRNERAVRTASSEQVRQPIYASAVDHWRHYEPWLDELKAALGPEVLERYPILHNS